MIAQYLAAHKNAWSKTTLLTEASRLRRLGEDFMKKPEDVLPLWEQRYSAYTLKQNCIRAAHFIDWCLAEGLLVGNNQWRIYLVRAKAKHKHAYKAKRVDMTFDEAVTCITQMDSRVRPAAEALLKSGLRISELARVVDGRVVGKGGRERFTVLESSVTTNVPLLRQELARFGLTPHALRKLFLTRCAEKGASPQDLCEIAGWSSIQTAFWYLQPQAETKLRNFVASL